MSKLETMKMTCPVTNAQRQLLGWGAIFCHPVQDMIQNRMEVYNIIFLWKPLVSKDTWKNYAVSRLTRGISLKHKKTLCEHTLTGVLLLGKNMVPHWPTYTTVWLTQ